MSTGSYSEAESTLCQESNSSLGNFTQDRGRSSTLYQESGSAIPGVPVDAPLTVKQHFQQQRKQQKNRARREARKQTSGSSVPTPSSQAWNDLSNASRKREFAPKVLNTSEQRDLLQTRALSEPAFSHLSQSQQMRPSTSRSVDQEIMQNANMKVDPRLLRSFDSEDHGLTCGGRIANTDSSLDNNRNSQMGSVDSYESIFHIPETGHMEQKGCDVLRNETMRSYCSPYQTNRCDAADQTSLMHNLSDGTKLEYSLPSDLSNMYSSMDGLERGYGHCDPGISAINGVAEQNHSDTDPTSFDQGVEKLDTETDERFLSWLYCENEHAEDDDAEYTRVLEEIEKDECYPHKMEGDNQIMDFGVPSSTPSTTQTDVGNKKELDPSHPLASDCVVGEYASLPPTMPPRNPATDGYSVTDFDSDLDLDMMPTGEDEETLYGRLLDVLVRDIKLLTYNNAALVDEVSRLNYAILIASEERKVLARRSCHHDRNRIRRLQTANKRRSDAQRRQQEQLTIAETQENVAQIKAKMAKTIVSPQKTRPSLSSALPRPSLDVAAIKRSVEAEQRALEERMSPKKPKRRVGGSKGQRKRPESTRSEKDSSGTQNSSLMKRGRSEAEEAHTAEEYAAPLEIVATPPLEAVPFQRRADRLPVSGTEIVDGQNRRRRSNRQMSQEDDSECYDESATAIVNYGVGHDEIPAAEVSGDAHDAAAMSGEGEQPSYEGDEPSWRRRCGRPPARAASAAAHSLLAAELEAIEEVPPCSPRRAVKSRSNTSDPASCRPVKRPSRESSLQGDLDLEPKDETADDDIASTGDATESDGISPKGTQRLRPVRRSMRSSSRQSTGDVADGVEPVRRASSSPSHQETEEKSDEPVARTTRSHGRTSSSSSTPQSERQMRERKQPTLYSPVAKNTAVVQPRVAKRKS
ncbi:hypothetical protein GCK32_009729 [Trichostrongylus colubriformis]|uniref:Uncharacterized protein n=1 Tax=Trichostrongylus colubriformis TaxID=6319 RepID=A0AAN8G1R4_TRICO